MPPARALAFPIVPAASLLQAPADFQLGEALLNPMLVPAASLLQAPAGFLFDKGVAKPCPRGTYLEAASRATFCNPCPEGFSTTISAAISLDNCTM